MKLATFTTFLFVSQNAIASVIPHGDLGPRGAIAEKHPSMDLVPFVDEDLWELDKRDIRHFRVAIGVGARAIGNLVITGGKALGAAVIIELTNKKLVEPIALEIWEGGKKLGNWVVRGGTCKQETRVEGTKIGNQVEFRVPT